MKVDVTLKNHPYGNKIILDGADVTSCIKRLEIVADAEDTQSHITLELQADVTVNVDGSTVHLEYPHEVKKFFPGRQYKRDWRGNLHADVKEGESRPERDPKHEWVKDVAEE
jgi:hypothetical protein